MQDERINWRHQILRPPQQVQTRPPFANLERNRRVEKWLLTQWKTFAKENRHLSSAEEISYSAFLGGQKALRAAFLVESEYDDFVRALGHFLERTQMETLEVVAVRSLLAKKIAHVVQSKIIEFDLAARFFEERGAWIEFSSFLADRILAEAAPNVEKWKQTLVPTKGLPKSLLETYNREKEQVDLLLFQWQRQKTSYEPTFDAIFRATSHNHLRLKFDVSRRLSLLRRIAPDAFIKFLDQPFPDEIKATIIQHLRLNYDPEFVLNWIRKAPPCINSSGKTVSTLLMFALKASQEYAQELESSVSFCAEMGSQYRFNSDLWGRAQEELKKIREVEVSQWFVDVYTATLKRSDGESILIDFSIEIIRSLLYRRGPQKENGWSVDAVALDTLCKVLAARNLPIGAIADRAKYWSLNAHSMHSVQYGHLILLGIGVAQEHPNLPSQDINTLWSWYSVMLKEKQREIVSLMNPHAAPSSWPFQWLGWLLLKTPNPNVSVRTVWSTLYQQRVCHRFHSGENGIEPSRHLARSLRGALDVLLSETNRPNAISAKEVWALAAEFEKFLYTTYGEPILAQGNSGFRVLFCYVPMVFKDDWVVPIMQYQSVLKSDGHFALKAAAALVENKISAHDVLLAFSNIGINLREISIDLENWHRMAGLENEVSFNLASINKLLFEVART